MAQSTDQTNTTTGEPDEAAAELLELVAELAAADDDRWWDAVVSLIDDCVHATASERFNTEEPLDGESDEDAHERLHGEADLRRAEVAGGDPEMVAWWLIGQLGATEALTEIRDRLAD